MNEDQEMKRIREVRAEAQKNPIILMAGSAGGTYTMDEDGVTTYGQFFLYGFSPTDPTNDQGHIYVVNPKVLGRVISELVHLAHARRGEYRTEVRRALRQVLRETNLGV